MRVVVAVCCNELGEVLLAQRAAKAHLGGTWEFPGGKVETGESDEAALARELREEVGLDLSSSITALFQPLLTRQFNYPDRSLTIVAYTLALNAAQCALLQGCEGQTLRWEKPEAITLLPTPAANAPLIAALCWPSCWHITSDFNFNDSASERAVLAWVTERCTLSGISHGLVLRLPQWPLAAYVELAKRALALTEAVGLPLLLHGDVRACASVGAFGFHASSSQALQWQQQALSKTDVLPTGYCLAVATHDADELALAQAVAADWAWLSPVLPTPSHPAAAGLGWLAWAALAQATTLPVYALGGLDQSQVSQARSHGGVGVAGISGF